MLRNLLLLVLLTIGVNCLEAQPDLRITIALEASSDSTDFLAPQIQSEIETLLGNRYSIRFDFLDLGIGASETELAAAYQNTDIMIGAGFDISQLFSGLGDYPKPTILTVVLDHELQGLPISEEETSGLENLSYIESFFDIRRDLQTLYALSPYQSLTVLYDDRISSSSFDLGRYLEKISPIEGVQYNLVPIAANTPNQLETIPASDAVYAFPLPRLMSDDQTADLLNGLADQGRVVFSLFANPTLELGAYAAYDTDSNLGRIPRRVALNVMKIVEGTAAADLKVTMRGFTENLVINMEAARRSGIYPTWEQLSEAVVLNINEQGSADRQLDLKSAVAEGLERNLELSVAEREVTNSELEVRVARGNYLPQLDLSASGALIDEASVRSAFGTRGYFNLSSKASLSQLVLSEPALANVAIQRLLLESNQHALHQNQLDVVLDVTNAYLNILQAKEVLHLRNENVALTRQNLDLAQSKESVGYVGTSDVYRLESELALDNIDLNFAIATLRQARFSLNSILNRPIDDQFPLEDLNQEGDVLLQVMDPRIAQLIENPGDAKILADFMVQEARRNLPEIKQIEAAIAVQERSLLSQNRAFYLPQLVLSAEYNLPISASGYPEGVDPVDAANTYSAALSAQLPLFQGNIRRNQREQTQVGLLQLGDQIADLRNKLEFQVRANLETVAASYSQVELARIALTASRRSYEISQDAYQQGLLNITSLLDAQNALLQTEINATTAIYTFIADFIGLERSTGSFHALSTPAQQDAYYGRFIQFMSNRQ